MEQARGKGKATTAHEQLLDLEAFPSGIYHHLWSQYAAMDL